MSVGRGDHGMKAAGYQGSGSILSAALEGFVAAGRLALGGAASCQLELDVTSSGESAHSLFASVDGGRRQVSYMASGYLSARVPELAVLDLPFSVSDRSRALAALDGSVGRSLRDAVAERSNMRVLGFWDNGFRHITNWKHPIRSPRDCAGLVIRTLDSAVYRAALDAIGFKAVGTDVKELQRVVTQREVDAQENPLTNFINFGLWRQHPHVSLTGHCFGVLLLVCHAGWFDSLSSAERPAVQHAADEATAMQRRLAAAQDDESLRFLRAEGVQVVERCDIDIDAMRRCCEPVIVEACRNLPSGLAESYLGGAPGSNGAASNGG